MQQPVSAIARNSGKLGLNQGLGSPFSVFATGGQRHLFFSLAGAHNHHNTQLPKIG